jgi:hypothetical protein
MSKFEDSALAKVTDWTEDVRTRDYYPSRFEYLFKDVLMSFLANTSEKDRDKCIAKAILFTKKVEDALDSEAS